MELNLNGNFRKEFCFYYKKKKFKFKNVGETHKFLRIYKELGKGDEAAAAGPAGPEEEDKDSIEGVLY